MKLSYVLLTASLLALTACGGTGRPIYSGHQESTEGVPGFKNGQKTSPYAKLGQSYSVDGETHVPRFQPNYVEEGMASWYGPGFHGGKTANGERYDSSEMTAAHKTLPLPSMVRVTMLETGKSAIVRVNDRGPFSKGRIIDLSKAAAQEIGLIRKGTARVRVEYLGPETEKFASLLEGGRDPKEIDIAQEVLLPTQRGTQMASASRTEKSTSWLDRLNPVASAHAHTPDDGDAGEVSSADVMEVTSSDLASPSAPPVSGGAPLATESPFAAVLKATTPPLASSGAHYFQLGAFANLANAETLKGKVSMLGAASVQPKHMAEKGTFYVVRLGPYTDVDESSRVLAELERMGINPKTVH